MTKLEQVARAIRESETWSSFWSEVEAQALARVAIQALMEPSEGMERDGGARFSYDHRFDNRRDVAAEVYKSMLQHILDEK